MLLRWSLLHPVLKGRETPEKTSGACFSVQCVFCFFILLDQLEFSLILKDVLMVPQV